MKKNGILTLLFAFIPGAGQMYQGYMKRGLSLMLMAAAISMAAMLIPPIAFALLVVFMYAFSTPSTCVPRSAWAPPRRTIIWSTSTRRTSALPG